LGEKKRGKEPFCLTVDELGRGRWYRLTAIRMTKPSYLRGLEEKGRKGTVAYLKASRYFGPGSSSALCMTRGENKFQAMTEEGKSRKRSLSVIFECLEESASRAK